MALKKSVLVTAYVQPEVLEYLLMLLANRKGTKDSKRTVSAVAADILKEHYLAWKQEQEVDAHE